MTAIFTIVVFILVAERNINPIFLLVGGAEIALSRYNSKTFRCRTKNVVILSAQFIYYMINNCFCFYDHNYGASSL